MEEVATGQGAGLLRNEVAMPLLPSLHYCFAWFDAGQHVGQFLLGHRSIEIGLQADPELVGHTEVAGQAQPGIRRHGAMASDDLADPVLRHADRLGQAVPGDAQGLQEFVHQDLAGSGVGNGSHGVACPKE